MARGEKSGNPGVKRHRASRIAERMQENGAPRAQANRIATAAMDREYADGERRTSVDVDAHDSRTGQRKTNLTTKKGIAVSGASKPSAAAKTPRTKASSAKKPRGASNLGAGEAGANASGRGKRQPVPKKAAGARQPGADDETGASSRSKAGKRGAARRVPRSTGAGGAGAARKAPMAGRASTAKKSSGVTRTAKRTSGAA